MIDRKLTNEELIQGLTIEEVEVLPPTTEDCLSQLRFKKKIPYFKIYGKIYYQVSELIKWEKSKKVAAYDY